MCKLTCKSLLCGLLLAITACSPPSAYAEQDGPEIVLSAAQPEAEFLVTLCVDRPESLTEVTPSAHVNADVEVIGERAGVIRAEVIEVDDEERQDELDLADEPSEDGEWVAFSLESDGPWEQTGRHCTEQSVRFEYEGDAEDEDSMTEVRLTWHVNFYVEYWYEGWGRSGFEDDDVSVEIAAVE
jgi:hypothetical protein